MNKTMDFNSKEFQDLAAAAMKELSASGAKLDTLDDMYNAVSKYVKMTKDQFMEFYNQTKERMEEKELFETKELESEELDMVVGGMPGWLKTTLIVAGCVVATALVATALGAGVGSLIGVAMLSEDVAAGLVSAASASYLGAAASGAAYFGAWAAGFGAVCGLFAGFSDKAQEMFD